jgi:hypothetical protein
MDFKKVGENGIYRRTIKKTKDGVNGEEDYEEELIILEEVADIKTSLLEEQI